jgi:hypothetical protein
MNIQREGDTIYELDENDTNKWSFNVQAGYKKRDIKGHNKYPQSMVDKVSLLMENAENLRVALAAAIEYIDESPCDHDITSDQEEAYYRLKACNAEELLNKLK